MFREVEKVFLDIVNASASDFNAQLDCYGFGKCCFLFYVCFRPFLAGLAVVILLLRFFSCLCCIG